MASSGADGWGVEDGYHGTDGAWHATGDEARAAIHLAMGGAPDEARAPSGPPVWTVPVGWGEPLLGPCRLRLEDGTDAGVVTALPPDLPLGRHHLDPTDGGPSTLLLVRPRRCHRPADLRASALAVQAYAARSTDSWGIGDLRDLRRLGTWAAAAGIDLLALSPLHAPTPGPHPQASPYYPSSRRRLNPLHLCVDEVPGAARLPAVAAALADLRATEAELAAAATGDPLAGRRIDRSAAWRAKAAALEALFAARDTAQDEALATHRAAEGADLEAWATFCAIAEVHPGGWRDWPDELGHPDAPGVARFAVEHAERIRFHCWLQLQAEAQVRALGRACPLITDLAVGVDPGGADAWIDQDLLALDARVGAPPDEFAAAGQDWGLPPAVPHRWRAEGYETFARTVRANLRHGAGIRIDHVLGLFRLFWIPPGGDPRTGAYVRYPAEDLLAVLAIESVRAGALVVGEDLGTVGPGVRAALDGAGVLGTRLVWFEDGPPSTWDPDVVGAVTTHDLPTAVGAATGQDARQRAEAGLGSDGSEVLADRLARVAFPDEGDGAAAHAADDPGAAVTAAHRALATSRVAVAMGSIDDVLGVAERPNMPGTVDAWPNWSIALPVEVDRLVEGPPPPALRALADRDAAGAD